MADNLNLNLFKFVLLLLLSLLFVSEISAVSVFDGSEGDSLIRQVVDDVVSGENDLNLGAKHHFSLFKRKFGKSYASREEHDYRFGVFKANLCRAQPHQALDPSASHGVTKFSDLTRSEVRRTLLGLRGPRLRLPEDAHKAPILPTNDLPTDFGWRDHGAVTEVKNQSRSFRSAIVCDSGEGVSSEGKYWCSSLSRRCSSRSSSPPREKYKR